MAFGLVQLGQRRDEEQEEGGLPGDEGEQYAEPYAHTVFARAFLAQRVAPGHGKEQGGKKQADGKGDEGKGEKLFLRSFNDLFEDRTLPDGNEHMADGFRFPAFHVAGQPDEAAPAEGFHRAEQRRGIAGDIGGRRGVFFPLVDDLALRVDDGKVVHVGTPEESPEGFLHRRRPQALARAHEQAQVVSHVLAEQAVHLKDGLLILLVQRRQDERAVKELGDEERDEPACGKALEAVSFHNAYLPMLL